MRVMIAGTGSGCGKTTVCCALLAAMKRRGENVVSFKCGPDYIDPTFHRQATGVDCFNLDSFLMREAGVLESLGFHSKDRDFALIEGVMGLYDGIGRSSEASCNRIALLTKTPTVLVVDTKGKGLSICAEIHGFLDFEENRIAGVILNRTKPSIFPFYKKTIEERIGVPVLGFMPVLPEAAIESRYLGLVTADELSDIRGKINLLGRTALETIDFDALGKIAATAGPIKSSDPGFIVRKPERLVRIDVAFDRAFCFHYADNHRILENFGAEIRFFSPLEDAEIRRDADGLIFWGGYPELHAASLAANGAMKRSILKRHAEGIPILAECGGFMYAQKEIVDPQGISYEMLGLTDGTVSMTDRLQQFGYVELTAEKDNLLCEKGGRINAHSFHYSRSTDEGRDFTARKASGGDSRPCIVATKTLFAGYPHLHFACNPVFARQFIDACRAYKKKDRT